MDSKKQQSKMERLEVGKYTVDVRRSQANASSTILLVHGIGVSSAYFLPFYSEVAQHYSVTAIDLPGYGQTPKPRTPLSVPELAEVVANYLRQSDSKNAVLVGHSMGCQIVAHVAKKAS